MKEVKIKLEIIENTKEAKNKFGHFYGSENIKISKQNIDDLINNKQIAIVVGASEHVIFISMYLPDEKSKKKNKEIIKKINSELYIIENTRESQNNFCSRFNILDCKYYFNITKENIDALLNGYQFAINTGFDEYSVFISLNF